MVGVLLAFDVGRQRQVAVAVHQFPRRLACGALQGKSEQRAVFGGPAAQQLGIKAARVAAAGHVHGAAGQGLFADLHVGYHFIARASSLGGQDAFDQQFQFAATGLLAKDAGLDDAGVVEDEQIAFAQQAGQFTEDAVCGRHGAAVEQARCAALGGGVLCDEFGGQREVEVAEGVGVWCQGGARGGERKIGHELEGRTGPCQEKRALLSHAPMRSVWLLSGPQ